MKNRTKTNLLLILMLALHYVWLIGKNYVGNAENAPPPSELYWFVLAAGVLVILSPYFIRKDYLLQKNAKLLEAIKLNKTKLFFFAAIPVYLLLNMILMRYVHQGNDEQGFLEGAQILVSHGRQYFFDHYTEIPWLGRQHPPLPVLLIGYPAKILGSDVLLTSRFLASLLGLGISICTFFIAKKLFDQKTAVYSAILLFGIQLFYQLNLRGNNDIFVTFFFTLSILLLLQINQAKNIKKLSSILGWSFLIGLSISLGNISKYTMVLIYPLLPLLLIWPFPNRLPYHPDKATFFSNLRAGTPQLAAIVLCSLPLLVAWLLFLYQSDIYQDQVSQISGYLGTEVDWSEDEMQVKKFQFFNSWRMQFFLSAVFTRIPASFGLYSLPLIAFGIGSWIVDKKREQAPNIWSNRFILGWMAVVFIPVLMTLPVDRYFMPAYPAIAILMAHGLQTFHLKSVRIPLLMLILSISSIYLECQ